MGSALCNENSSSEELAEFMENMLMSLLVKLVEGFRPEIHADIRGACI